MSHQSNFGPPGGSPPPKKTPPVIVKKALSKFFKDENIRSCPYCGAQDSMKKDEHHIHYASGEGEPLLEDRTIEVPAWICKECEAEDYEKEDMVKILAFEENKSYVKFLELEPKILTKVTIN